MLNMLYITEYVIKVHSKNKMKKKTQKVDKQKLADDAMRINHTRLFTLKRWCFSMLLK